MSLCSSSWVGVAGTVLLLLAGAVAPARSETLNLLIWESYISPEVIQRWQALTHTDVSQVYFDSGDKRDSILSNPASMIDLAIIENARIGPLGEHGLLSALDPQRLPNLTLIDPKWRTACGSYGAAYLWGIDGILYRRDKLAVAPASWPDLLQPAPWLQGHIAMLKDDDDLLAAPLSFLKRPTNTDNIDDLKRAFAVLKAQAPSVLTYDYVVTAQRASGFDGKIYMALGYTGDQVTLNRNAGGSASWHFAIPREGSVMWADCLAVVNRSRHRELALKFINFVNEPENAAENALYLKLPTPNRGALRLLPEAVRADPEIYPSAETMALSQLRGRVPAATLQLRRRIVSALTSSNDAR